MEVIIWFISESSQKGLFLLNRTSPTHPTAKKKDPLAQYAAKTADPSCLIGVHNVYVFYSVSTTT